MEKAVVEVETNNNTPCKSVVSMEPQRLKEYTPPSTQPNIRQNVITTVMLHGVQIVCLYIDAKERLCLAQISNTLLQKFSYNEIHNRRVALGITCVQCTPVQLEILRRAGAMPISSRRCGMITKREAERLVRSFLEDIRPPKLPDTFAFEVYHECGWGSRGRFMPSRYNSSRAKCIKCTFCSMYFSPNKFIFHFHRTPEAKYNHPDAANFNSWRRHLKLTEECDTDDSSQAWEDVKAMFNGGSRKRIVSCNTVSRASSNAGGDPPKKPKSHDIPQEHNKPSFPNPFSSYPIYTKGYPFSPVMGNNQFGMGFGLCSDTAKQPTVGSAHWRGTQGEYIPSTCEMLWANHLRVSRSPDYRSLFYPVGVTGDTARHLKQESAHSPNDDDQSIEGDGSMASDKEEDTTKGRLSAFRQVRRSPKTTVDRRLSENSEDDVIDEDNVEVNIMDEEGDIDSQFTSDDQTDKTSVWYKTLGNIESTNIDVNDRLDSEDSESEATAHSMIQRTTDCQENNPIVSTKDTNSTSKFQENSSVNCKVRNTQA